VGFFFSSRRRHTRLVSDWSSDVCSSDLDLAEALDAEEEGGEPGEYFLGTMLFIERQPKRLSALPFSRQSRLLEVVDGLQRLTTRSEERRVGKECRCRWWSED